MFPAYLRGSRRGFNLFGVVASMNFTMRSGYMPNKWRQILFLYLNLASSGLCNISSGADCPADVRSELLRAGIGLHSS